MRKIFSPLLFAVIALLGSLSVASAEVLESFDKTGVVVDVDGNRGFGSPDGSLQLVMSDFTMRDGKAVIEVYDLIPFLCGSYSVRHALEAAVGKRVRVVNTGGVIMSEKVSELELPTEILRHHQVYLDYTTEVHVLDGEEKSQVLQ